VEREIGAADSARMEQGKHGVRLNLNRSHGILLRRQREVRRWSILRIRSLNMRGLRRGVGSSMGRSEI
jgi:hypothetical protein